jgi:hypothetical protein
MFRSGVEMLVIRHEQMLRLAEDAVRRFPDSILEEVRQLWPDRPIEPSDVEHCLQRARRYGLSAHPDLLRFVGLCALLDADFEGRDDPSWAKELLDGTTALSPSQKLQRVFNRAIKTLQTRIESVRAQQEFEDAASWTTAIN